MTQVIIDERAEKYQMPQDAGSTVLFMFLFGD